MRRRWCLSAVALVMPLSVFSAAPLPDATPRRTDTRQTTSPTSGPAAPDKKALKSHAKEKWTEEKGRGDEIRSTEELTAPLDEVRKLHLIYETQMAVAAAFKAVDEKAKAIDSYEKAILAAPDEEKKAAAMNALNALAEAKENSWLNPTVEQVQSIWVWIAVAVVLLILSIPILLLRRLLRWLINKCRNEKRFRVMVMSAGRAVDSPHFRNLIQQAHDGLETQRMLIERIGECSVVSIISSFRSNSLVAMLPFNLPTVLAKKWWSPAIPLLSEWLDPPDYSVAMTIMPSKSYYGVYVRLTAQRGNTRHWRRECPEAELPAVLADLAFEVIANINHRQRTGDYVY